MAGSIERVTEAARRAGLDIEVKRMGASTRTSEEAAAQCGCGVAQIMKSLIFQGEASGRLYLFLLQGSSRLSLAKAEAITGEKLARPSRG
jgi:prolyl-tRNA editing enzyme YbaK/EbsC (Cys-tRNA(Pro) deacylase)